MVLQYASDLHLEFPENKDFLSRNPIKPLGDVLILAGDIVPFAIMDKHSDFFKYVSDNFEKTYWIPGNHEYYYAELTERYGMFHEKIKDNVHLLNNTVIEHDNVNLIFSTLWSEISIANRWHIERNISDFQVIKYKDSRFNAEQFINYMLKVLRF